MAHYDTFRDQLAIAHPAFGYALWEPDPGEHNSPVEVGDVGYIRQGRFHRIFNALLPTNHPSHEDLGVPEGHEPLRPRMQDHINRGTLSPNTFYSYGVTVVSGGLEVIAAETANSVQDSFSFARKYGAVLSLPVISRREDTLVLGHFRKWIITHIDSWFAFAQKHRLGIEMEDIILVTGCHRATSWTHVAFNEVHADAQRSSGPQITGNLGDPANWPVSGQHSQGTVLRHGPSGENLPENQCVFVRGYRVARTSEILSRVRRVGPTADPSGSDSGLNTAVVPIPRVTEYRDPLHLLLEYIAKQAPPNCDMVLVHDDDLTRLSGIIDGSSLEALNPDAVMRLLQRSEPQIKVMSDANSNGSPSTATAPLTVAMLQTSRQE